MPNDLSISLDEIYTGVRVKKRWNEKVTTSYRKHKSDNKEQFMSHYEKEGFS